MSEPLVSILIPVYNVGGYLRPSVQSILSQTYCNLEVIVIDDGCTDGCMNTISDLRDSRIRVLTQSNAGKSVALNRALDELSGEFYAIHDADDISYPRRIERQVWCLLENSDLAAVFTGHDIILNGKRIAPRFRFKGIQQCREDIERMCMPSHDPTAMFRVSLVKEMRYDPSLRIGQGFDYILRLGERYPMMVIGENLYSYRIHLNSITRQDWRRRDQKVKDVLKRACRRRGLDISNFISSGEFYVNGFVHRKQEHGIVTHFMESVLDLRRAGRGWDSLKTAVACLRLHPIDPYYYKPLCYFLAPLKLIECYRLWKAKCG